MPSSPLRRTRRGSRATFEPLESRLALSASVALVGQTLTVTGTPGPDHIQILGTRRPDTVRVVVDGRSLGRFGPVARIRVDGGAGDDRISVGQGVRLPARLDGGPGNDILRGGSGPDLLFGGAGNDVLFGSSGRDALDAGPGQDRVIVLQKMGVIRVGPSASGESLRVLAKAYSLRPLRAAGPATGPMIVGTADLRDPRIVAQLRRSYAANQTVGLTNATASDAETFRALLGHPGVVNLPAGASRAALVTFRQAPRADGQTHFSTDVILPRSHAPRSASHAKAGHRLADENGIAILSRLFSSTPVVPEVGTGDSPPQNLLQLANSYESSFVAQDSSQDQVQIVNTVWDARSFQSQNDYYYVLQQVDYVVGGFSPAPLLVWNNSATNEIVGITPTTIQPTPSSTTTTTTETSGVSFNLGGTIGFNAMGPMGGLTFGVTISNSKTTQTPPVSISYLGNLVSGNTVWTYDLNQFPQHVTYFNQWIWAVPFSAYAPGQTDVVIASNVQEFLGFGQPRGPITASRGLATGSLSKVPLPFGDVFALAKPVVTGVSPSTVREGNTFVITGTGFYPSLVTGVLIGGQPLAPAQFSTVSDTQITAVASALAVAAPVVVQTTQGLSNDNFDITIL